MAYNNYNLSVEHYDNTFQGFLNVVDRCNSFTVTNLGDTIATINDIVLFPSATPATDAGDSVEITGNDLDVFRGVMKLSFNFPVGANPRVQIVQQYYTNGSNI